jgi:plasmid stabilization system protein ParE
VARALIYAPEALADIDAAALWLTQPGSGSRARRVLAAIRADIRRLRLHPCLWPIGDHSGVRELPCAGGHRALYRVNPDTGRNDTAGNVRVFGPGQDRGAL